MTERFTFSDFHLDLRTRELHRDGERLALAVVAFDCLAYLIQHRDRPVGRDELISAVWGRTDVSESTLAHTIVRLRQCLGDTGNDQRCIRTIPRLGYRWVAPVEPVEPVESVESVESVEQGVQDEPVPERLADPGPAPAASPAGDPVEAEPPSAGEAPASPDPAATAPRSPMARKWGWVLATLACVALASVAALWTYLSDSRKAPPVAAPAATPASASAVQPAMVEPAKVLAPEAWAWLRLGAMDLVANRLREGRLPTLPSETALVLAGRNPDGLPEDVSMRVRPYVQREGDGWRVLLDATVANGRSVRAEAQGRDVMQTSRAASDRLLAALGMAVPADGLASPGDVDALQQRIAAARLGGHLEKALSLLEQAPAAWRTRPEIALVEARIHCDMGHFEVCRERLDALAGQVSSREDPDLYGQMRVTQAWLAINSDSDFRRAGAMLDEVIGLKPRAVRSEAEGHAYSLRAWMRTETQPEAAMADLGQARAIFLKTGNLREIARVDQRMGMVLGNQGRMSAALTSLRTADRQFENLGARGDQVITQMAMAHVYGLLLQHGDALATTDRFWNTGEGRYDGAAAFRAWALMRKGRLAEAESLVASIVDRPGSPPSDWLRADLLALSARIAFARGRYAEAARSAAQARALFPADGDRQDYLDNGMVEIRALRAAGQREAAARAAQGLMAWVGGFGEERLQVGASLLRAEQARAEGRASEALASYARALAGAEHLGIPEILVDVGSSYMDALIASGRLDAAGEVSARLAPWAREDVRAALVQARMLQALGNAAAADAAYRDAARLAGEGSLAAVGNPVAPAAVALAADLPGPPGR